MPHIYNVLAHSHALSTISEVFKSRKVLELSKKKKKKKEKKFTVFVIFCNFSFKNLFIKVKISLRRRKEATNFDIFSESSEHYLSPLRSSFFPYFKASCRKIHLKVSRFSRDSIMTSL